jgi:tetratricopeptide (TPR) repeat protein
MIVGEGSAAGGPPICRIGVGSLGMKAFAATGSVLLALGAILLAGCETTTSVQLDPLNINGRDGTSGKPLSYDTLMRVGAAAHAAGDLATAIGIYRRAAAAVPGAAAPLVAAGNTLLEMAQFNEAIVAYNSALARNDHDPEALRGLVRAYLMTGKPELAGKPLAVAYRETPNDPKLLELIGVTDDLAGQHGPAQARYRRGLELLPHDPGLSIDLALSLAITGNYPEAIAVLRPIATAPSASPRERQTLALIYGLAGDRDAAAHFASLDLGPQAVERNLAYYDDLRRLSPDARTRALQSFGMQPTRPS